MNRFINEILYIYGDNVIITPEINNCLHCLFYYNCRYPSENKLYKNFLSVRRVLKLSCIHIIYQLYE